MDPASALPPLPPSDTCVKCGLCLPHCPTYRLTGNEAYSPRGRLAAMSAVLHGDTEADAAYDDALSTCLGCRACEAVCPGLVPYGLAFEVAKADLVAQRPTSSRRARRTLLGRALTSPRLTRLATAGIGAAQRLRLGAGLPRLARRGLRGLRPVDPSRRTWKGRTSQAGAGSPSRGTAAALRGCVMDDWFGAVHDATVGILNQAGYDVAFPPDQTCCGALAAHDGHAATAQRLAKRNVGAFAPYDLVVSNSAGCTAHLKEYGHWGNGLDARVVDVTELVADLIDDGTLPRMSGAHTRVAMQDPCHLRHAQRIVTPPRTIVAAAGYEPVEIDDRSLCCGAAGIYSVLQPAMSDALGEQKVAQIRASGATLVAAANPGCEMQIRAHADPRIRVVHPVELYWDALTSTL